MLWHPSGRSRLVRIVTGIGAAAVRWMKRRRESGDDGFMVNIMMVILLLE